MRKQLLILKRHPSWWHVKCARDRASLPASLMSPVTICVGQCAGTATGIKRPVVVVNHGSCPMDQECAQVGIPSFADAQQVGLTPTGMLFWQQLQPSSKLAAIVKALGIGDGGDQCAGSDGSDARTQSLRFTPRISSFLANESLRFVAFAAVSVAAWMALGPLLAAAWISPNL